LRGCKELLLDGSSLITIGKTVCLACSHNYNGQQYTSEDRYQDCQSYTKDCII